MPHVVMNLELRVRDGFREVLRTLHRDGPVQGTMPDPDRDRDVGEVEAPWSPHESDLFDRVPMALPTRLGRLGLELSPRFAHVHGGLRVGFPLRPGRDGGVRIRSGALELSLDWHCHQLGYIAGETDDDPDADRTWPPGGPWH